MILLSFWREFFGFEENTRNVEGFLSWQHILVVTIYLSIAFGLAIYLGKKYKNKSNKEKDRIIGIAAISILSFELLKYIIIASRNHDAKCILGMLPLFLCSMQLIAIPLAWLAKGFVKQAACNFVFIFGILAAITGTYLAANHYDGSPVLSFDPINSGITHSISGFTGLYIAIVGYVKLDKKTLITDGVILFIFEMLALTANHFLEPTSYESNYMFLRNSAGTPFEIINTIVNQNQTMYTIGVCLIYFIYMFLYIFIYSLFTKKRKA